MEAIRDALGHRRAGTTREYARATGKMFEALDHPHGKFVLIFVDVSGHSSMGCQLSLAPSQPLGAGFGRHRAAR